MSESAVKKQVQALSLCIQAGEAVKVEGPPGTGKTKTIYAICRALGLPLEVVIASLREPSDFAGLPVQRPDGSVDFAPPSWAVRIAAKGKGVVFLDEANWATPATQAAMLRPINEGYVGDLKLPEGVSWVLATNPTDQGGGYDLISPFANRIIHLDWQTDTPTWAEGMVAGFPDPTISLLPENWREHIPQARALVATFAKVRPALMLVEPKDASTAGGAWPSFRSWDMASRMLAATIAAKVNGEVQARLITGCIGQGAAFEFIGWVKNLDLPDPEDLLKSPESFKLLGRGDRNFAVLNSVTAAVISKLTLDRWNRGWKVVARAAELGAADVAAAAAKALAQNRPKGGIAPPEARTFLPLFQAAGIDLMR